MKILISAPSGFNAREILLPLAPLLKNDAVVSAVQVISPQAQFLTSRLDGLGDKFFFSSFPDKAADQDTLLSQLTPNIVVTPTIGLDDKDIPIIRAAARHQIPTCTFVASWDNVYKIERLVKYKHAFALPDSFAVWNQLMKDHLIKLFPQYEGKVDVIGVPRFDFFFHHDRIPTRSQLFATLNINKNQSILHCATTELYPFDYIIRQIDNAIKTNQLPANLSMYASVHPGGDISHHSFYSRYGAKVEYSFGRRLHTLSPEFRYLPTYDEIYRHVALFKYSSVLINQSSTVAIESMLADVPVINVKYGRRFDWWRWRRSMVYRDFQQHYHDIIDSGGTTVVKNKAQLLSALKTYLDTSDYKHTQRQATIKKLITFTDGQSSQRLINLLKTCAAL